MPRVTFGMFNEGSLLRRTLLHVGTFVLGSLAFIGLLSFLLVSVAKGLLPDHPSSSSSSRDDKAAPAREGASDSEIATGKPAPIPRSGPRSRRGRTAPGAENGAGDHAVE